jgi:hypothetical protein
MAPTRIFLLIVLILSCSVLDYGCSKAVRSHSQTVAVPQTKAIFPLAYVTTSTRILKRPAWVKDSVKGTTGIGTWMDGDSLAGLSTATELGTAAAFAYVAYVPVAAAVGTIVGKNAEKKWRPCLEELSREIGEVDPASALQKKLGEELHKFHGATTVALPPGSGSFQTAAQQGAKSFLQAEIQGIQLRQCLERGSFCLWVTLRAQLWGVPEKSLYLDKVLVYTSSLTPKVLPPEILVLGASPCRKMADYCGALGKQRFREELALAIDNLAKRLSWEMGL